MAVPVSWPQSLVSTRSSLVQGHWRAQPHADTWSQVLLPPLSPGAAALGWRPLSQVRLDRCSHAEGPSAGTASHLGQKLCLSPCPRSPAAPSASQVLRSWTLANCSRTRLTPPSSQSPVSLAMPHCRPWTGRHRFKLTGQRWTSCPLQSASTQLSSPGKSQQCPLGLPGCPMGPPGCPLALQAAHWSLPVGRDLQGQLRHVVLQRK